MTATVPLRALVVEDDVLVRGATARALNQEGFLCEVAADGAQALEKLRERKFDVVISDLRMPEMNGHRLIVETLPMEGRPAIIVLTGVTEPRLVRDLFARGVDDVMAKPANYDVLVLKAKALAQRRRPTETFGVQDLSCDQTLDQEFHVRSPGESPPYRTISAAEPSFARTPAQSALVRSAPATEQIGAGQSTAVLEEETAEGIVKAIAPLKSLQNQKQNGTAVEGGAPLSPAELAALKKRLAQCEQVTGRVKDVCGSLPAPPPDYDGFRIMSGATFDTQELIDAIQVKPVMASEILLLTNNMLFRMSEQISELERAQSLRAKSTASTRMYLVGGGALLVGILVGCLMGLLF